MRRLKLVLVLFGSVLLITSTSLFLTPHFVNVEQPDPTGLAVPIGLGVGGLIVGLVAVPLLYFAPGNYELATLVQSQNSALEEGQKIELSRILERRIIP